MLAPGRGDSQLRIRKPAILIGHSGAGPLLAAAGAILGQVRGYIFVDAAATRGRTGWKPFRQIWPPSCGRWLMPRAGCLRGRNGGARRSWPAVPDPQVRGHFAAGCPRLPLAMFEEVHPPVPQWPDAPAAYLQLSEAYEDQAAKARELGWPVMQRVSHHLAPLTDPGLVTESLRELLGQLGHKR